MIIIVFPEVKIFDVNTEITSMAKLFYSPVSRVKPPGSEHSEPEAVLKGHAFP